VLDSETGASQGRRERGERSPAQRARDDQVLAVLEEVVQPR
jgi:hypothetical protein